MNEQRTITQHSFQDAVRMILDNFCRMFVCKHEDYGPCNIMDSALKDLLSGTEYAPFAVEWGVLQRLGDKYHQLIHLYAGQSSPNNESLEDSWNDVMGYALVALLVRRGWFSLPLDSMDSMHSINSDNSDILPAAIAHFCNLPAHSHKATRKPRND